ncbi:MAG: O-antigen ligase family protein [Hyphomicrobiaceae bacterium]|nr:O-antigen ligase family protein [Hyphomicrobiaceae bacterium]
MQNDTASAVPAAIRGLAGAAPGLALTALLVAFVEPRATPGLIALLTVPAVIVAAHKERIRWPYRPVPLEVAAICLGAYIAINASWSVEPLEAYGKVALYAALGLLISLAARAIPALGEEAARRLWHAVIIAVGIAAAFLAVEAAFGQPIKRAVSTLLPFLRPPAKHVMMEAGRVVHIGHYVLNRNVALLCLMLWPALLMARAALKPSAARVVMAGLLGLTAIAVLSSEHETSMLALVAGCLVFAGMWALPGIVRWLVVAGWVTATLLIVPLAASAYSNGLYQAQWMPKTARNRIVLWGVTASKVRETPLLGVGLGSTKSLDQEAADSAAWPKDHPYPLRTGRHSHNIYMQTWYELGAVGAALLLALGLALQYGLSRLSVQIQPYAYASLVTAALVAAFSWGMWQPWFMAAFGFWGVGLLMAQDAARRTAEVSAPP